MSATCLSKAATSDGVSAAAYATSGRHSLIICGHCSGGISIWQLRQGGHLTACPTTCDVSHLGEMKVVELKEVTGGTCNVFGHDMAVMAVEVFTVSGALYVVTLGLDYVAKLWSIWIVDEGNETDKAPSFVGKPHVFHRFNAMEATCMSSIPAAGSLLVGTESGRVLLFNMNAVMRADPPVRKSFGEPTLLETGNYAPCSVLAKSPDGKFVAVASATGDVSLFDVSAGSKTICSFSVIPLLRRAVDPVMRGLAFTPTGSGLVFSCDSVLFAADVDGLRRAHDPLDAVRAIQSFQTGINRISFPTQPQSTPRTTSVLIASLDTVGFYALDNEYMKGGRDVVTKERAWNPGAVPLTVLLPLPTSAGGGVVVGGFEGDPLELYGL